MSESLKEYYALTGSPDVVCAIVLTGRSRLRGVRHGIAGGCFIRDVVSMPLPILPLMPHPELIREARAELNV
jgi:hypothetical protein